MAGGIAALALLAYFVWPALGHRDPPDLLGKGPNSNVLQEAHRLWQFPSGDSDAPQVASYLAHLAARVEGDSWRAIAAPAFKAWERLRQMPSVRDGIHGINRDLVPKLTHWGSLEELSGLVRAAGSDSFDAPQIAGLLSGVARETLPPSGFPDSPQELLIAACFQVDDWKRARLLLAEILPGLRKERVAETTEAANLCIEIASGKLDLPKIIRAWQIFDPVPAGRSAIRPALERQVLLAIASVPEGRAPHDPEALVQSTVEVVGAEPFWERILYRAHPLAVHARDAAIPAVGTLCRAFAVGFSKPEFEQAFWTRAGELAWRWTPDNPLRAAECHRRAFLAALTDSQRLSSIRQLVFHSQRARTYADARRYLMEATAVTKGSKEQAELSTLLRELDKSEEAEKRERRR